MDTLNGKLGQYNCINMFNADTIYKLSRGDVNLKLDNFINLSGIFFQVKYIRVYFV